MATAGSGIAEAYVLRKLHNEKLKTMEEEKAKVEGLAAEVKQSSGCFLSMFKKTHPVSETENYAGKGVERLDNKE